MAPDPTQAVSAYTGGDTAGPGVDLTAGLGDPGADTPSQLNNLFGVSQAIGGRSVTLTAGNTPVMSETGALTHQSATKSVAEVLQGFYGMDAASLKNMQQMLLVGGFYADSYYSNSKSRKQPQYGVADEDTYEAYKRAVIRAARSGKPFDETITAAAQSGADSAGAATAGPTISFTNPDDIRYAANRVAHDLLGKRLSDDELSRFVSSFQGLEQGAQGNQQQGGSYTQAPDLSSASDAYIREHQPGEVLQNSVLTQMANFAQILAGPHPQVPQGMGGNV